VKKAFKKDRLPLKKALKRIGVLKKKAFIRKP